MTATLPLPPAPTGPAPGACLACQAPLGSAARYCLHCGARQAAARTELIDLVADPASVPAASAAPPWAAAAPAPPAVAADALVGTPPVAPAIVGPTPSGVAAPRTWPFALTAVILLTLVIGLLAGRWLADGRDEPAAPQVIRVVEDAGGTAPSTAAPAPAEAPTADPAPAATDQPAATDAAAPAPVESTPVESTSGAAE